MISSYGKYANWFMLLTISLYVTKLIFFLGKFGDSNCGTSMRCLLEDQINSTIIENMMRKAAAGRILQQKRTG